MGNEITNRSKLIDFAINLKLICEIITTRNPKKKIMNLLYFE